MTQKKEENPEEKTWQVLTAEAFNSIVRRAKKLGIGEQKSPRQDIEEYIKSDAVPVFDPIREYMNKLPKWDGKNHVAALFGRIPGLTSEQLAWCATWFRSAVAHWLQMDMLHGNETVPVIIGQQGCGKVPLPSDCCPRNFGSISSTTSTSATSLIQKWLSPTISS